MKKNKAFMFASFIAMISVVLIGSGCKDDDETPPVEEPPVITCTSNITDGCMDDWKTITNYNGDYINPTGDYLQTLNELASLPVPLGPGPTTAEKVTDCVQGTYAAKLISKTFYIQAGTDTVFIPGYIGTSVLDIPNATIHLGKPYALRPQKLQGYYKYAPAGGDSAVVRIMMTKYNTGSGMRDTISYDQVIIKNAVTSYTLLDLPLTYHDMINNPDTLMLLFAASGSIDLVNLMGSHGQDGSALWVDDLKFIFP